MSEKRYIDFNEINFEVSIEQCFENLKPHPKFAECSFDNYIPDENYPSQHYIKELLKETLIAYRDSMKEPEKKKFSLFKKKKEKVNSKKPLNIYIDGSFGIGKTHLLSSCYNTCQKQKAFLSFSEMNYYFHYLGVEKCIEIFGQLDLLLIDEFELDDPATCLIIAKFFREISQNTLIVTTSNTLPSELGKNKFQTDKFEREMGQIAESFKTIIVEGEDYRKKMKSKTWKNVYSEESFMDAFSKYDPKAKSKTKAKFADIKKALESNHPFRYFVITEKFEAVFIDGLEPFQTLNDALRFNQFMDQCYYYNTKLFIRSDHDMMELFSKEMLESCFQKKLLRCYSRLEELAIFYRV